MRGMAMIDTTTKKPLHILTKGTAGPYIVVPVIQLGELSELLDKHCICYTVDDNAISLDGEPEVAVVDLGHGADVRTIQAILDNNR